MLECSATLCTGQAFHRVRLIDVSKSGCKITVPHALEAGKSVQIALEAYHSLGATVRWCREGSAGLQFSRPLGDTALVLWKKAVVEARAQPAMPADKRRRNFLGELIAPATPRRPAETEEAPRPPLVRGARPVPHDAAQDEADPEPELDLGLPPMTEPDGDD
jgi:hypothetical protein